MRTLQEIQPGQTLGRYEFLLPIAEGGMASVWAARLKGSRGFSKTVAVKTMLPSVSDDPQFEQMFLDEAQIASRIRHPNVVEILDLGEEEEVLYLVMEWVDGEPLSNLRRAATKSGGIPRNIAIRVVADACAGLHAAHELRDENGQLVGLVHRDISPQNVLITFDGVVKIVDFGVAKAAGRSSGQTTAGQVKGKPPYMSPEQALGEAVDRRTDVFALGIILYQLTTGKHPFRGESDLVTLQNIVSDKPIVSPRAYDKQYPRLLESVVMKALDRRRDARFQTCAEFEAALDEVFAKEVPRARTEDVGKFMKEMFGTRSEERRKALSEAIRAADELAQGRGSRVDVPAVSRPSPPGALAPTSGMEHPNIGPVTPFEGTIPAPVGQRRRGTFVLGALGVAALVGALVGLRRAPTETPEVASGAASGATVQKVATAPPTATSAAVPETPVPVATPDSGASAPEASPKAKTKTRGHVAHVASHPGPAVQKAAEPPKPQGKPSPKGGFVPPPMSDPGF
jgi:serine/threonine-protein kinase